ncbi:pyrroline-5-carboxylate reductase [Virgibacillus dakarensis]|uniref:Pyrroline-5-carboxylate reductase n=1 Tax=Lentibacillus populi TaxID=1827502 RepID=A0A9W5X6B3_9BACI|nr:MULTISPECIES: pyrroline-5-carboxylate reductase [Bacillaceae]MBT2216374.1 pyrroline-5-carboxylate reductase [Virgibacillus dakarensis]MTW86565.1 pyrroline-5-carboxylate reductase [Virgibacillus dakarensis]GGB46979.1 pyrroline-5-carboxylate reductase 1 [Lentibacillus populi]
MLNQKTIAFLGAGSMAEAMISGMIKTDKVPVNQIIVTNKGNQDRLNRMEDKYRVRTVTFSEMPFREADFVILAMKPKGAEETLATIKDLLRPDQVVISVLAGISTSYMEERLNAGQKVIRVMPNTSSMIQESATAMSLGTDTNDSDSRMVKELLSVMGKVYVIEEEQMDIFTGLAGSGPAYFYYLIEQMENIGKVSGMDGKMARKIAAQTLYGAAKMIMDRDESPAELRKKVTSPNGTTAAGLEALKKYHGGEAISQAVSHATNRSREISEEIDRVLIPS